MGRFVLSRILQFPLILAVIYLITFAMVWIAPGDPFQKVGQHNLSAATENELKVKYHAGNWREFLRYYPQKIVLEGDFGPSMEYEQWSVNDIIAKALPVSVSLGVFAMVLATFAGVALGTLAAVRRGGIVDMLSLTMALVGISLPSFVAATLFFVFFVAKLHWFPAGTWGSPRDMILPGIALSLLPMAYIARLTRVAMIDTLGSDYVRTARAKGLSRSSVVWKHALRNAFLPVLSYLGPAAAYTLTGSFVVEQVFNIPGLGQHFINSVLNRDRTLILGTVIVYSFFVLGFNLLVDLAYGWVDPRIDVAARRAPMIHRAIKFVRLDCALQSHLMEIINA